MPTINRSVDEYIINAPPFATPVLQHLRALVHIACPEVVETIKWGCPHFMYNGKILCSMAAFKQHCAFGFRNAGLMKDAEKLLGNNKTAMGSMGRITSIGNLPSDKKLSAYIKEAATLNKDGAKLVPKSSLQKTIEVPEILGNALAKNKKAKANFEALSYSHKKEYINWINGAKTEVTRDKRIATTIEWVSEGKSKEWRYSKK